ncbi:LAFE_0D03070g1_1 [Lachancea fermentati]|uniref:LAFE_0D03070g1_1 n=1 Tax=Lachancea fermentati TaxID=4955 RepID=A0A1G4MAY5_LACFM|nr:LAFE_0D03070g1_1 [Lachancea fermentati]
MSDQQPQVDAQVSEAINSALDQLHLDDLPESSVAAETANPGGIQGASGSPPGGMFPPPQMMGMGFMHYPHMMHLPHSPGFFHTPGASESYGNDTNVDIGAGGPPIFSSPPAGGLDIGLSGNVDPLWSNQAEGLGADYKFISGKPQDPVNSSRRQTFHAISGNEMLENSSGIRNHSISLEKSDSLGSSAKPAADGTKPQTQASNVPYSAAAYPYGGPLVQPNPVLSGHPPPGSAPAYGIPSPFPAYGFSSPFQSFSPIPGTPLANQGSAIPPTNLEELEKSGGNMEVGGPRQGSSQPPAPWMYSNHPFGHMVPMSHHQMLTHGGNNNSHYHPSHHGNHHSSQARRHKGGQSQKPYHRKGEDPAKYANAKLEDYLGNIYSLCKDQHGCRFLQKQLDIGGPNAATAIFEETKQYTVELMTDSFGNYLIQKLLERVNDEQRLTLVKSSAQSFVFIALDPHGTRALQKLVECMRTDEEAQIIIESLRDSIVDLSRDLNGNHVVQKCLQKLKPEDAQFIFDAACKECVKIATHRHGCCVLQRCLDHGNEQQCRQLCEQIISHVDELAIDPFGNYVVQYILTKQTERSDAEYTNKIVNLLKPRIIELSLHKFGSNVIEKTLRTPVVSEVMITELLKRGGETGIEQLLHDGYGNYVLQTALDIARESNSYLYQRLAEAIKPLLVGPIRNTPHGRRIMGILEVE